MKNAQRTHTVRPRASNHHWSGSRVRYRHTLNTTRTADWPACLPPACRVGVEMALVCVRGCLGVFSSRRVLGALFSVLFSVFSSVFLLLCSLLGVLRCSCLANSLADSFSNRNESRSDHRGLIAAVIKSGFAFQGRLFDWSTSSHCLRLSGIWVLWVHKN